MTDNNNHLPEYSGDFICRTDTEGNLVVADAVAARSLGYSEAEMRGRNCLELIRPDYREAAAQLYRHQLLNRTPATYSELPVITADGRELWLGQSVELLLQNNRVVGFQVVGRDITERRRAEERLKASEARYRALYEANPHMVITVAIDGKILGMNASGAERLGYAVDEMIGKSVMEVFPEEKGTVLHQIKLCARDETQINRWEIRCRRKDGEVIWVSQTARAVREADGQTVVLMVCEDITERRQAQDSLRKSAEWFSRTFNTSPVPMLVRRLRDGVYIDVNDAFVRECGYTRREIVGLSDAGLNLWGEKLESDSSNAILGDRGRVSNIEGSVRRKDGSIRIGLFAAEITIIDGEECALIAMNDITERKKVEEALRKSEDRFKKAFTASANPASITTLKTGQYIDVNDSFLKATGYAREEVIGRTSVDLGIWEEPEHREEIIESLKQGKPIRNFELSYRNKFGERGVWLVSADLIEIQGERFVIATRNDITERKRAEERFSKAFHSSPVPMSITRQGRFLDLNASFAATTGFTREEVIGRSAEELTMWPDDAERERVARIYDEVGHSRNLEVRFRMKCGQVRTFLTSTDVIEVGGVRCMLVVANDITDRKLAEEALRASEERFSAAFYSSPAAMSINRFGDGQYLAVNDSALRLTGYSREETLGKTANELFLFVAPENLKTVARTLRDKGEVRDFETTIRSKEGERRTILFSGHSIQLDGERCILSTANDITERKKAEEALRNLVEGTAGVIGEAFFPEVVRHVAAALGVRYAMMSEVVSEEPLVLRTKAFWLGDRWRDNFDYSAEGTPCENVFSSGGMCHYESRLQEQFFTDRGLVSLGAESYLGTPLFDSLGKIIGHLCVMDVKPLVVHERARSIMTIFAARAAAELERKRAEDALRESESRVRRLVESNIIGIVIADFSGTITDANDAFLKIVGFSREDLEAGRLKWTDITPPEFAELDRQAIVELKASGVCSPYEKEYCRKDGSRVPILLGVALLEGSADKSIAFVLDLTEQRSAQNALRESEKRFRALIENSADGVVLLDNQGTIKYASPAGTRMLGYKDGEKVGAEAIHPDDLLAVQQAWMQLLANTSAAFQGTYRFRHKDGSWRWIESVWTNLLNEPGINSVVSNFRDVTERVRAEEAVRESERRFRTLIENSSDAIGLFDKDGTIVYASVSTGHVLGYAPEEFVGHNGYEFIHPDDIETTATKHNESLENPGKLLRLSIRMRHKDGTWKWVEANIVNQLSEPSVRAIVANYRDVTERVRAEQAMRESERRFRALIEHSSDAIALMTAEGRVFYASPSTSRVIGYNPEELIGKIPFHMVHPDDLESLKAGIKRLAAKHGRVLNYMHRTRHRDGSWRWIDGISTNLLDEPSVRAIVVNYRDVTERKQAEEEQAQLQAIAQKVAREWRVTFDAVEFPILLVDFSGAVARLNRAAMLLANKDYVQIKGSQVGAISTGEPWQKISEMVDSVRISRASMTCQTIDKTTDTTWDISAGLFPGSESDEEKVIVLARDTTATVRLQESLRRSETMSAMGQLVAGVAHEVRNPLFGMSATLDAFSARFGEPEYRKYIDILHGEVDRLSALMRDLLEYGKPLNQELSPGTVQSVVAQAITECRRQAETSGVQIENLIKDELASIRMDAGRMLQVFRNLIENAVQHSPSGSVVTVAGRHVEDAEGYWIDCGIEDSGPGFRTGDIPKVFDPFFTRRRGGIGLGLSIVQRIVEEHAGVISISNREGGGASVRVRFPVCT